MAVLGRFQNLSSHLVKERLVIYLLLWICGGDLDLGFVQAGSHTTLITSWLMICYHGYCTLRCLYYTLSLDKNFSRLHSHWCHSRFMLFWLFSRCKYFRVVNSRILNFLLLIFLFISLFRLCNFVKFSVAIGFCLIIRCFWPSYCISAVYELIELFSSCLFDLCFRYNLIVRICANTV